MNQQPTNSQDVFRQIRAQKSTTIFTNAAKFRTGTILATPAAVELLQKHGVSAAQLISRHIVGDWGDCCIDDAKLNETALLDGSRLFSVYRLVCEEAITQVPLSKRSNLPTVWVITNVANANGVRDVTTLLLPEDY